MRGFTTETPNLVAVLRAEGSPANIVGLTATAADHVMGRVGGPVCETRNFVLHSGCYIWWSLALMNMMLEGRRRLDWRRRRSGREAKGLRGADGVSPPAEFASPQIRSSP